jgi:Flp pilus assembly protein protease CpaA
MIVVMIVSLWAVACSGYDLVYRRVPNWLLALGIVGASLVRAGSLHAGVGTAGVQYTILDAAITLSVWMLAMIFWLAGWWGAADAKFSMALSLAFPNLALVLAMAIANVIAGLVGLGINHPAGKRLPAVAILTFGWLAWAILFISRGYS